MALFDPRLASGAVSDKIPFELEVLSGPKRLPPLCAGAGSLIGVGKCLVVASGAGRFVEVQGTGEDGTFSREQLTELTAMALGGIASLTRMQGKALAAADGRTDRDPGP